MAQSAFDEFNKIVSLIAGDKEKSRAERLKDRLRVVKDEPSARILELPDSARISDRAKISFGTGETHSAVTVSSNTGFIRASRQQVSPKNPQNTVITRISGNLCLCL